MPKKTEGLPKETQKFLDAVTQRALKSVLKDEVERIGQQEGRRIAKKLIADNRQFIVQRIEAAALVAFKKTLRERIKKLEVDVGFDY